MQGRALSVQGAKHAGQALNVQGGCERAVLKGADLLVRCAGRG